MRARAISVAAGIFRPADSGRPEYALAAIGYQYDGLTAAHHAAGPIGRQRTAAEEHVAARRALDGGARILGDQQPTVDLERTCLAGHRPLGVDPDRRAVGREDGVDGEAALGGERHALRAGGSRRAGVLEEDVAFVLAHHLAALLRMALQPVADRRPVNLVLAHHAHVGEHAADRGVGPVVRAVEADRQHAALGEMDAPRALHLDLEQCDRILHPGDLQALALQRALLDLGACVVGALAEIAWPAIDRHGEDAGRRAAAAQFGLEIAGELAGCLDDQRPEILLEEATRATRVAVLDAGSGVADRLPLGRSNDLLAAVGDDLAVGARGELRARALEGAERLALPVIGPARNLVERDRRHMDLVLHGAAAGTGAGRQEAGGSEQHATSQDAPPHADVGPPLSFRSQSSRVASLDHWTWCRGGRSKDRPPFALRWDCPRRSGLRHCAPH